MTVQKSRSSTGLTAWLIDNWVRVYFSIAILLIVFGYGMATAYFKLFPYQLIADGAAAAKDWSVNGEQYVRLEPSKHLRPARRPGDGVTIYDPEQAQPGITLLSGMWNETLGMKLVDMDGTLLHEWRVSFNDIWPNAEHLSSQPHDWDTNIHGVVAQPNGDIVFNFEHDGLVSINACGDVNWKYAGLNHHSVHVDDDGNLWVPDERKHTKASDKFPWVRAPFSEDMITVLTPDGKLIKQFSIMEELYASGYESLIIESVASLPGAGADTWRGTVTTTRSDITHLNDVETLSKEMADAFPLFKAGDIMLSLRNLDLILILDGNSYKVKWAMTGPWLMQHDPDFLPNGTIMLFDNRARIRGQVGSKGSRILTVDPVTREVSVAYQGNDAEVFLSTQMGKQQLLKNGNILIAEPDGGRAFEVNSDGEIVWEFINRWSEEKVAMISGAQRLPADYFTMDTSGCN